MTQRLNRPRRVLALALLSCLTLTGCIEPLAADRSRSDPPPPTLVPVTSAPPARTTPATAPAARIVGGGCGATFELATDPAPATIPLCLSQPIDEAGPSIDRAVIVLHGNGRDHEEYFETMQAAAATARSDALIIAPLFADEDDLDDYDQTTLAWSGSGWREGDQSLPSTNRSADDAHRRQNEDNDDADRSEPEDDENTDRSDSANRSEGVSSYTVMDQLLALLAKRLPQIETIVIAGHSAGGQYVQRYAAGTGMAAQLAAEEINVRYVVANPSSYMYFSAERPADDAASFAPPTPEEQAACPEFNEYRYGLENMTPYMEQVGAERLRQQFAQSTVVYLLGEDDNDPQDNSLDLRCPAQLQGPQRYARGLNFYAHLRDEFGSGIEQTQRVVSVPGVGHDGAAMLQSRPGIQTIFDVDPGPIAPPSDNEQDANKNEKD